MVIRTEIFTGGESIEVSPIPDIRTYKDIGKLCAYDAVKLYDNRFYDENIAVLGMLGGIIVQESQDSEITIKDGVTRRYRAIAKQIFAQLSYAGEIIEPLTGLTEEDMEEPYINSVKNAPTWRDTLSQSQQKDVQRIRSSFGL